MNKRNMKRYQVVVYMEEDRQGLVIRPAQWKLADGRQIAAMLTGADRLVALFRTEDHRCVLLAKAMRCCLCNRLLRALVYPHLYRLAETEFAKYWEENVYPSHLTVRHRYYAEDGRELSRFAEVVRGWEFMDSMGD